jgi:hypothetical protein
MASDERRPEPSADPEGAPWCTSRCRYYRPTGRDYTCAIAPRYVNGALCLPAVRELAAELAQLRARDRGAGIERAGVRG